MLDVERLEPALPWRVIEVSSWGAPTKMQSASMQDALAYFRNYRWDCPTPFNQDLQLQRWTGSDWHTEARRNSGDQQCHGRVDPLRPGVEVFLPQENRSFTVSRQADKVVAIRRAAGWKLRPSGHAQDPNSYDPPR